MKSPSRKSANQKTKAEKEYLYVGHYIDENGNYILKVGTTNDLDRRKQEHTRNYRKADSLKLPKKEVFKYDWHLKLSKYNTLRYEDKTKSKWKEENIGEYVRNDRFNCGKRKPAYVEITIRKTYIIPLGE